MTSRKLRSLLLCLAVLLFPWTAESHSPYQPTVLFAHSNYPDRPISEFAKGRLGVVRPQWNRGYLMVAYRYLSGNPLSEREISSFLQQSDLHPDTALKPYPPDIWLHWPEKHTAAQQWVRARAKYRKGKPPTTGFDWWNYSDGGVCLQDSFLTAIRTLEDRARRYGSKSSQLQQWIDAQDQVYRFCSMELGGTNGSEIPEPLPATAEPLARADRAYQIAAAHFYAKDTKNALAEFEAIGRDVSSPWHTLGAYLAARTLLQRCASEDLSTFDPKLLAEVDARFAALADDPTTSPGLKRSIVGLREYIALRLRPKEEYRRLTQQLSSGKSGERFGRDLSDLGFLMDRLLGDTPDFPNVDRWSEAYQKRAKVWRSQQVEELHKEAESMDLADWVLAIQFDMESSSSAAKKQWERKKSLPWLVAALISCKGQDREAPVLIQAASKVEAESPAFATVSYHRARLLRERGDVSAASVVADGVLQDGSANLSLSVQNLFRSERMLTADSLETFLRYLPLQPVGFDNGVATRGEEETCYAGTSSEPRCESGVFEEGRPRILLPQIDRVGARILNRELKLKDLIWIAESSMLPQNLRKVMAPALWARAVLLDRQQDASAIAPIVESARPELKPYLDKYAQARSLEDRRFLSAFAIVHYPGWRPFVPSTSPRVTRFDYADDFRDNWWGEVDVPGEIFRERSAEEKLIVKPPRFYSSADTEQAHRELQQLANLGASGDWLPDTLVDWARKHPEDERAPEALHFAMRAIRFAPSGSTNRSKEIFVLLHKKYPQSPWTKKTKYWYSTTN